MPERQDSKVEVRTTTFREELTYWPFEVPPPEKQSEEYRKQIQFLETAFALGFRPCTGFADAYKAFSPTGREVCAIRRYRPRRGAPRLWEVWLFTGRTLQINFWLDDFDFVSTAGLNWLHGRDFEEILPMIQGHVVRGRPRIRTT